MKTIVKEFIKKTINRKPWTMSEIDFLKQNHISMTYKEIGKYLNRSEKAVNNALCRLKIKKGKRYTKEEKEKIIFLVENGMSYREIAYKLKTTTGAINSQINSMRKKGITINKKNNKNLWKRWSEEEYEILKKLYPDTSTQDIAKLLGRSEQSVFKRAKNMELKKSEEYMKNLISK